MYAQKRDAKSETRTENSARTEMMTRADVKTTKHSISQSQRWHNLRRSPTLLTRRTTTQPRTAHQSPMEDQPWGRQRLTLWCCSSCCVWQASWLGGWPSYWCLNAEAPFNPTSGLTLQATTHTYSGSSLNRPLVCDSCRQYRLLEALSLLSLANVPAHITWELPPRAPSPGPHFTTLYQPTTYVPWPTTLYRPVPHRHGVYQRSAMRRPSQYDSDSSTSAASPRRPRAYAMEHQLNPPLNQVPTLALYFHSIGSQIEPPNPEAEVPPGYRLLGRTANSRLIVERVHPWRQLAWQGFVQGLRVVGAIGTYLATGLVRCLCGALIRVYRFVARFLCAIPRDREDGPVHALPLSDLDPGPVSAHLYNPPDLCQVGGTHAPLTAANHQEAEYTRRTVSRVIAPIEEIPPDRMEDSSSDESETSDSEGSDGNRGAGPIQNVGPHLSRSPPAEDVPSGREESM